MTRLSLEQIWRENQDRDSSTVTSLKLSVRALTEVSCLSDFKNLERLDLSCNNLSTLEGLQSCISLKWLSVVQNKLESLKGIEELSKLTVLNAGQNRLQSMYEVRSLMSLRALILNDNNISSICKLDQSKYMNTLVLSRNPINDIGDSLLNMKSITKLSLSNCKIQNIGSSLTSCLDLKEVRLAHNEITTLPTELAQNIKLQNLDLGNNSIRSWSDLKVLSALRNLKNLNLQGNPVAEKDKLAKKIKKMVPNLQIFNAKPTERDNRSEMIPKKDIAHTGKDSHSSQYAGNHEAEEEVKRKRPNTSSKVPQNNISNSRKDDHALSIDDESMNEIKRKKSKASEKVFKKIFSSLTEDEGSPFDAADLEKREEIKERKYPEIGGSKFEGFDDGQTSFMNLFLSENTFEDSDGDQKAVPDKKLLGGLVVGSSKRKKKVKSTGTGHSVPQPLSPLSEIGMGGPSTWDD